jgi:hypothetical protein
VADEMKLFLFVIDGNNKPSLIFEGKASARYSYKSVFKRLATLLLPHHIQIPVM